MARIPKGVINRLKTAVPKFKRVLKNAADRDVNESDTVTIVVDMLSGVFQPRARLALNERKFLSVDVLLSVE